MFTEALFHRASLYSLHSIVNTNLNQFDFLCHVWKYGLAWKQMIFGVLNVENMINYHNQKPNSAVLMKIKGKCSSLTELYWWLYKLHSTAALFAVLLLKHTVTLACDRIMKHLWVQRKDETAVKEHSISNASFHILLYDIIAYLVFYFPSDKLFCVLCDIYLEQMNMWCHEFAGAPQDCRWLILPQQKG